MKVLITGGSRGIGEACVRAFCKRGDRVAFLYRSNKERADALATETGAVAIMADISQPKSAQDGVKRAIEVLGGVDVLVNNAGISQIKLFTDLEDSEWEAMLSTNLSGAFYITRAVVKEMIANQFGRIINIGSRWGKTGSSCEVHYSTTKAGMRGFTKALAKELGLSNITVNCIEPGVIDTEMNSCLDEETKATLCEATPLCRFGSAEDVAFAVCFFASEEAGFITGQILGVDGGFAI